MNFSDLFWNEGFLSGCRLAGFLPRPARIRAVVFRSLHQHCTTWMMLVDSIIIFSAHLHRRMTSHDENLH